MVYRGKQRTVMETILELTDDPDLKQAIAVHTYRAGETVAGPSVLSQHVVALIKGRVQLIQGGPKGRCIAMATLSPGAVFGEGLWTGRPAPRLQAVALTDCLVWTLKGSEAQGFMLRYPSLSWAMLLTVSQRLMQVEDRMEDFAYKRLPSQLAGLLIELANGGHLIYGTSHQSLASMLGTYRETVSSVLRTFKDAGLVELGYRRIELRDLPSLRATAESVE
jgi:CRP/FNR family transcriptional regulator, cyclic AMP receptor protein